MHTLAPVILSGGSGTRLWPLSREKYPKQLLSLVSDDSLLQATIRRMDGLNDINVRDCIVVCNEEYRFVIAEQLRLINRKGTILLEPIGRNTAPALTIAALSARHQGDDPILLVMPSDHVIDNTEVFKNAVQQGIQLALKGHIVTFGITPNKPEANYGYIQIGDKLTEIDAYNIASFVEKPDTATAQAYLEAGSFFWNSGLFLMRASIWLQALELCHPEILSSCRRSWNGATIDGDFVRVEKTAFEQCTSKSIDYAVMEHIASEHNSQLPAGSVIPLAAGWSDIGAWDSLWHVLPKDHNGNVTQGDVVLHECSNTLAISKNRLVACVGVKDMIVVETPDAILVVHKDQTQSVKKIVDSLKENGRPESRLHRKIFRPWGWYDGVDAGERFQVKRIVVKPGAALSLQMHHHRTEHWIVVRGTARVTRGNDSFLVTENESTFIPVGTRHRLENPGCVPLEMIEVQSGPYLGEDDIVRFEDFYGRNET
ncbi:MAG: mannose-1-phosphate guanylyltransferase/mannose-6-phosphate isomerase [Burkholderiales bacterium]|nr:mannose-1-phosphate guanylyltransferase/mannose-6-phosphate isomerase [Nitrosomonas sp.]MCP5273563.1 mannose-1-phosphate guanylyltransferase/mannose-6-phosphate isomerase [Burkholderiales bacterium]